MLGFFISEVIPSILNPDVVIFIWSYGIIAANKTQHRVMDQVDAFSVILSTIPVNFKKNHLDFQLCICHW